MSEYKSVEQLLKQEFGVPEESLMIAKRVLLERIGIEHRALRPNYASNFNQYHEQELAVAQNTTDGKPRLPDPEVAMKLDYDDGEGLGSFKWYMRRYSGPESRKNEVE